MKISQMVQQVVLSFFIQTSHQLNLPAMLRPRLNQNLTAKKLS